MREAEVTISQSEAGQTAIPTVDEIVHDQLFYAKLSQEQSDVFRQNVLESEKEFALYEQSAEVVKRGQNVNWIPAVCDRDAFMAEMKKRCREVPNSIADRVKIYYAAHAIVACLVFVDMIRHTKSAQLEILEKLNKKTQEYVMSLPTTRTTQTPPVVNLLTRSIANPCKRPLTVEDYTLFTGNPTTLPDKQFLLEEDGESGDSLYEVTEVRFLKGSWEYLVRFEGCCDCIAMSGDEMKEMLERSSLVVEGI